VNLGSYHNRCDSSRSWAC